MCLYTLYAKKRTWKKSEIYFGLMQAPYENTIIMIIMMCVCACRYAVPAVGSSLILHCVIHLLVIFCTVLTCIMRFIFSAASPLPTTIPCALSVCPSLPHFSLHELHTASEYVVSVPQGCKISLRFIFKAPSFPCLTRIQILTQPSLRHLNIQCKGTAAKKSPSYKKKCYTETSLL